jgi:hypothetical protein
MGRGRAEPDRHVVLLDGRLACRHVHVGIFLGQQGTEA